jgi:hypothetical protein
MTAPATVDKREVELKKLLEKAFKAVQDAKDAKSDANIRSVTSVPLKTQNEFEENERLAVAAHARARTAYEAYIASITAPSSSNV